MSSVRQRIQEACQRVRRDPHDVGLILVTKEVSPSEIERAYRLGCRDFGENRIQELAAKYEQLPPDIRWHFIGHLQTNKVKTLSHIQLQDGSLPLLHSLDTVELAREIQKRMAGTNHRLDVLIQVNTSHETSKHGFDSEGVRQAVSELVSCDRLNLRGFMTIGPNTDDQNRVRESFGLLRSLRDRMREQFPKIDFHYLSMGMSSDYEIAIEEGANLLRIGTAVFGPRVR